MEVVRSIALFPIFGKPVVVYGGILTLCSFFFTAYISVSNLKGHHQIPFALHPKMAAISLVLACIHGFFALSLYWK